MSKERFSFVFDGWKLTTFDTNYTFLMHMYVSRMESHISIIPHSWLSKAGRLSWVLKSSSYVCVCEFYERLTYVAREENEAKKLELFTLKNRKQMCWRARTFLHNHQPRMNPPECRQPAGFNFDSHGTCARRIVKQSLAHKRQSFLLEPRKFSPKKTFLVSETEGSIFSW